MSNFIKARAPQSLTQAKRSLISSRVLIEDAIVNLEDALAGVAHSDDARLAGKLRGLEQSIRDAIEYLGERTHAYRL